MSPATKIRILHLRVSDVLYEKLEAEAARLGMMTTEAARYCILKYFEDRLDRKEAANE